VDCGKTLKTGKIIWVQDGILKLGPSEWKGRMLHT